MLHRARVADLPKPPTPQGHALWGHALELRRDLLGYLSRVACEHGDVVRLRIGAERAWLLSRAEDIERVLVTEREKFHKPKMVRVMGRIIFGDALTTRDGSAWRDQRRVVAPAFHRERVDQHASSVVRLTERELASWKDGETRALDRDLMRLTLCIAAESLLGLELGADADRFGAAMRSALSSLGQRARFGVPTPDWLPVPHNLRMRRAMQPIDAVVARAIAQQRGRGEDRGNLLSLLLNAAEPVSEARVRNEVVAMLLGGSQPASLAIAWVIYCLTQYPNVAAQLECEVDRVLGARSASLEDLPQLPYTRAVLDEALRLYPPFFLLARDAACRTELAGHFVPKGTTIFVSPWVTQRSERYFDEPLAFRPERWLDGRTERLPRFAYFPFSEGPRVCVAQRFALTQSVLALATLVRALRFELAPGHSVQPSPAIALGFARGLRVVVRQRVRP